MSSLPDELESLKKELLTMGALVEEAVGKAVTILTDNRLDLVEEVIQGDKRIDAMENTIDLAAFDVLALHQPVANDLRLVLLVMMANNELERAGDHAKNIAKACRKMDGAPALPLRDKLEDVSNLTLGMLTTSLDALINKDATQATTLQQRDKTVDKLCKEISTAIADLMQEDPEMVPAGIQGLRALQNLERIADLATNIAKDLIYFLKGEIIRHGGRTEDPFKAQNY